MMKESFVVLYLPTAMEVWKRFGLNPSVVLAQAANEGLIEKLSGLPPLFHPSEDGGKKDELYWWDRY